MISVIMPVYNGEQFLEEAIQSILGQTYDQFELIVIDDGSEDQSWNILKRYVREDRRIVLIKNRESGGLANALNKGLAIAAGEYIARQDQDDVSLPSRFEKQLKHLLSHPQIGVLGTAYELMDGEGQTICSCCPPEEHDTLASCLLMSNCFCHSSLMFRRTALEEVGGYGLRYPWFEDYDLLVRLSRKTFLSNLPEILVRYRKHENYFTVRHRRELMEDGFKISSCFIQENLENESLDLEAYRRFWQVFTHSQVICKSKRPALVRGDLICLLPLWRLLAAQPAGRCYWGRIFYQLSLILIREGRAAEGFQLLKIMVVEFEQKVKLKDLLRILRDQSVELFQYVNSRLLSLGQTFLKSKISHFNFIEIDSGDKPPRVTKLER